MEPKEETKKKRVDPCEGSNVFILRIVTNADGMLVITKNRQKVMSVNMAMWT